MSSQTSSDGGGAHTSGERVTPDTLAAERADAAILARYRWASSVLPHGRVLDAGCGTAVGSVVLADDGARSVIGTDVADGLLEAARPNVPSDVTLEKADVAQLPYDDASFVGAVCFDLLEHLDKPGRALDELRRVLRDDGVLAVSVSGAFEREVLRDLLLDRFAHVRLFVQCEWVAVGVVDADGANGGSRAVHVPDRPELASGPVLALASNAVLPAPVPELALGPAADIDRWTELWAEQDTLLRSQLDYIGQIERRNADIQVLNRRLLDAEQRVALVAQQRDDIARLADRHADLERMHAELELAYTVLDDARMELAHELAVARGEAIEAAHDAATHRQRVLDVEASMSWRMMAPARWVRGRLRRKPPGD
jgi:SAM-dependent methyltransferase